MPDDITKRMRYFDRQFLRAKDFQDEQAYHLDRRWRHNRLLHTYGIAEGLEVKQSSVLGEEKMVLVTRGTAYDPGGFEIVLSADQKRDLSSVAVNPGPPVSYTSPLYLTITYTEEPSDPSTDPGINGSTRTSEPPLFQPSPTAPTDPNQLLLAVIERDTSNGNVTTIDTNPPGRRRAGTLPPGSIGSAELRDGAVQSRHIAPADAGTEQTLTSGSGVKTGHIKDQAIAPEKLADNAVTSRSIADGVVTELKLADNAVTSRAIADQAIASEKLANNAVTSRGIAPADAGIDQTLGTGSGIKTGHIKDQAVTLDKIAPGIIPGNVGIAVTPGLSHDASIPIPSGFTREECVFFAFLKAITSPGLDNGFNCQATPSPEGKVVIFDLVNASPILNAAATGVAIAKKGGW
jgi:hypothetical protein